MAYVDDDDDPVWDLYEIPQSIHPQDDQFNVSLPRNTDDDLKRNALTNNPSSEFDFDKDCRIKALVETPALDCQQPSSGRGTRGGRTIGRPGFGRGSGLLSKTPSEGYVCRRSNVAGHFIQHCPTNGDHNYDYKKMRSPTGIPKSMLTANSDGFYALPSGDVGILKPDEAAFQRAIEGLPTTRSHVGDVLKELYCQLCKQIMNFAVLCSKCCFQSFCDECIRRFIFSKSSCVCGATNILADDLLPNLTVRKTISRQMESNDGSVDNGGCSLHVQDMESNNLNAKVPTPTKSAASAKELVIVDEVAEARATGTDFFEVITHELVAGKEPTPPRSVSCADNEDVAVQEGMADNYASEGFAQDSVGLKELVPEGRTVPLFDGENEAAKKKKKRKKADMPSDEAEMQWNVAQNISAESYMMPMTFDGYNPYWSTGIQPGRGGFFTPYFAAFPYAGFGVNPLDTAYGAVFSQNQFAGPPPVSRSKEEFEAGKSVLKRKSETKMGESSKDQELDRAVNSNSDVRSTKSDSLFPSRSILKHDQHRSRRPSPNRNGHVYKYYKHPRRHQDEHYSYLGDLEQHHRGYVGDRHHQQYHQTGRHRHLVRTCY